MNETSYTAGQRYEYEMTQSQFDKIIAIINVARTTPLIMLQCGMPESPQEAANRAWSELGTEMGFDYMTVEPGKDNLHFSAIAKAKVVAA